MYKRKNPLAMSFILTAKGLVFTIIMYQKSFELNSSRRFGGIVKEYTVDVLTSLTIRLAAVVIVAGGSIVTSAVMKSVVVTARRAIA